MRRLVSLILHSLILHHSHCIPSCTNVNTPANVVTVAVWSKRENGTEFRISDEDLGSEGYKRVETWTARLPRNKGDCPCLVRMALRGRQDGSVAYEKSDGSEGEGIWCAREKGDCGAETPIRVHTRTENRTTVVAYSFGTQVLASFTPLSSPLCYAWNSDPSLLQSKPITSSCLDLKPMKNAKYHYSTPSSGLHPIGTTVSLLCSPSFISIGHSFSLCTAQGWYPTPHLGPCTSENGDDGPIILPLPRYCPLLLGVDKGNIGYSSLPRTGAFSEGTTARVSCEVGYSVVGDREAVCREGSWSTDLGRCFPLSSFHCLPPLPVHNGKMSFSPASHPLSRGSVVRLTCLPGFDVEGRDWITCEEKSWSDSIGKCKSVQCPILDTVVGGKISYTLPLTPTAQGSTAVLVCEEGTVPHGSLSTVCLNGQWTNVLGTCGSSANVNTTGINCLTIPNIVNGRITYSLGEMNGDYPPGTTATPSCLNGYNLYGSQVATCLPSGQWTTMTLGNCGPGLPNECEEFATTNGVVNYNLPTARTGYRRESTIGTLACSVGTADGNVVSTCVGGKWSPPFGQCVIPLEKCTALPTPIGGSLEYSNGMVQGPFPSATLAKLTCTSTSLVGSSIVECREGAWQGEGGEGIGNCGVTEDQFRNTNNNLEPAVVPSTPVGDCSSPSDVLSSSVTFSVPSSLGVYRAGTVASLQCGTGSVSSTCVNGVWSPALSCGNLDQQSAILPGVGGSSCAMTPTGGAGSFPTGTTLTLQCPMGSAVMGAVVATCSNGQWTQIGSCSSAADTWCSPLGSIDRSSISDGQLHFSRPLDGKVTMGTVVRANCSLGYRVDGPSAAVCTSNGWQPPGIGVCVSDIGEFRGVSSCQSVPVIPNAVVSYSTPFPYAVGTIATVTCNAPSLLSGSSVLTCISGLWSPQTFPTCQSTGMTPIQPIAAAPVVPIVTPTTTPTVPLQEETEPPLTTTAPVSTDCQLAPLTPLRATLKFSSGNAVGPWTEGVIVALICSSGYHVSGAGAASCRGGSFQPSQLGSCVDSTSDRSPCTTPIAPFGGHFNFSTSALEDGTYPDGAMLALFCEESSIPTISTCSNEVWSPPIPLTCSSSMQQFDSPSSSLPSTYCPVLRAPPNGEITFSLESSRNSRGLYPPTTRAILSCSPGTLLRGSRLSVCTNGQFSPPLGTCF